MGIVPFGHARVGMVKTLFAVARRRRRASASFVCLRVLRLSSVLPVRKRAGASATLKQLFKGRRGR